ncbi:MAG: phosphoribosyl-AMP cyclohydrolase, partial [Pseudomonadota bacterium]
MTISDRNYEPMTKAEVIAAQRAWAKHVVERDVEKLLDLYDFGGPDEPLLFKPTLADVIRLDRAGARSYFVGGDPDYPNDSGFLNRGWTRV